MLAGELDAVVDRIIGTVLGRPIQRLVEMSAHFAQCSGAMLTCRRDDEDYIFSARGLPHTLDRALPALPGTARLFIDGPVLVPDIRRDRLLAAHPLAHAPVGWNWAVIVPIHIAGGQSLIALTCGDPRSDIRRPADLSERLRRLAEVIADEMELISQIVAAAQEPASTRVADVARPFVATAGDSDMINIDVASKFMLATLIGQRRLLRRGQVSFHALARWRASLKPWQIIALRALKPNPPPALIETIATDLAHAAHELYGTGTFQTVTTVACGSSGPDCFASKLGAHVADCLQLPYQRVFADLPSGGSSHPRRNARRPKMRVVFPPTKATLLIDDVATSGRHIEEAALLIRQTAPAALPLVWIAD